MTICYFGIYKSSYTRNFTMMRGLRENGVEVIECNTREPSNKKYFELIKKYWSLKKKIEVMVVGFPGHTIMPLAFLLAKLCGKKIVFDAFVSLYDSIILDRKQYRKISLKALKYWLIDFVSTHLADMVLLDAEAHAVYIRKEFKLKKEKVKAILVSCDDKIMYPRKVKLATKDYFLVHFHGTYIPIQGIEFIVEAAKILKNENIKFNLIGRLENYQPMIDRAKEWDLKNINFIDFMPYETLAEHMAEADVCLGAFGKPNKALRCNIFKVVEAMAMKKPLITGDTPAMREFLIDGENAILCKMADGQDLATKIMELKNNPDLKEKIAKEAYKTYIKRLTPKALAQDLINIVKRYNIEL